MSKPPESGKRSLNASNKDGPSLPKKPKAKATIHKFVATLGDFEELSSDFDSFSVAPLPYDVISGSYYASACPPSILPGDHVRRVNREKHNHKDNEGGYCTKSATFLTLKIRGSEKLIENVSSNDLIPLSRLAPGVCLYKSWIGYVKDIKRNVTLRCKDGAQMVVKADVLTSFKDIWEDGRYRRCSVLHNGQKLIGPKDALKDACWLASTAEMTSFMSADPKDEKICVTVEDSNIVCVTVKWFHHLTQLLQSYKDGAALAESDDQVWPITYKNSKRNLKDLKEKMPSSVIVGEDISSIKPLKYVRTTPPVTYERGYYVIKEADELKDYKEWRKSHPEYHGGGPCSLGFYRIQDLKEKMKSSLTKVSSKVSTKQGPLSVSKNDSKGANTESEPSSSVKAKSNTPKTSEKSGWEVWPSTSGCAKRAVLIRQTKEKRHKVEKDETVLLDESTLVPNKQVAVEVLARKSYVSVAWQNGQVEDDIPSTALFPVHHFDFHNFFPGDYVVDNKDISCRTEYGVVQRTNLLARTALVRWFSMPTKLSLPQFVKEEDVSVYDIKRRVDISFRIGDCVIRFPLQEQDLSDASSRAGQVIDFHPEDGQLLCAWVNGTKSRVYPQELFKINEHYELWTENKALKKFSESPKVDGDNFPDSWTEAASAAMDWAWSPELMDDGSTDGSNFDYFDDPPDIEIVEDFKRSVNKLDSWIQKNSSLSYPSALSAIGLTYRINSDLKGLEELLSSNLPKQKELQSLIEKTKSPSGSSGTVQAISANLTKAVARMNKKRSDKASEVPQPNSSSSDGPGTSKGSDDSSQQWRNCLAQSFDMIKKLHDNLMKICSKLEEDPIKNVLESLRNSNHTLSQPDEEEEEEESTIVEESVPVAEATVRCETFKLSESVPDCHHYKNFVFQPRDPVAFPKRVSKEISLLKSSLPSSILVKGFENRIDLYSALIKGPASTPYEDCVFLFDILLPQTYPEAPPTVYYYPFCSERINPNLYENGKVCVSLLGTWAGSGIEKWCPKQSNLLQLLVSIQGLILVSEPYFNEPGYVQQKGCAVGRENSRLYNEMVVVKLVQSMTKIIKTPPEVFAEEIHDHFKLSGKSLLNRLKKWIELSKSPATSGDVLDFPLLPGSQGFVLSLEKSVTYFKDALEAAAIPLQAN